MGTKAAAESRYLLKIYEEREFERTGYYATFDKKPFAEGTFRYCYKGTIKNKNGKVSTPDLFPNEYCVVKVLKKTGDNDVSDFYYDLKNYFYSKKISLAFNLENQSNSKIPKMNYVNAYATTLDKYATYYLFNFIPFRNDDQMEKIKKDELILIEPFIDGKYQKFINNDCLFRSNTDNNVAYFMHWNWVHSKGEKLICDVQGVKKKGKYELTDPATQSIDGEYGKSDLGPDSLIIFIYSHKHNKLCENLPWPNEEKIKEVKQLLHIYNLNKKKELYREFIDSFFNKDSYIIILIIIILIILIIFVIICIIKICKHSGGRREEHEVDMIPVLEASEIN